MAVPARRRTVLALAALGVLLAGADKSHSDPAFGATDVPTVFFISKSDDEARVDYGLLLDAECRPVGKEFVVGYWREFEKGVDKRTHSFHWYDHLGYGLAEQKVVKRTDSGAELRLRLKTVPRDVLITTTKTADGRCAAKARTKVEGVADAELVSAFVKLKRAWSVDYVELRGRNPANGAALSERLEP